MKPLIQWRKDIEVHTVSPVDAVNSRIRVSSTFVSL
jgi:hypothetical protein